MPPAGDPPHVLVLGGTGEGYVLAAALADRPGVRVTSSLAGVTSAPRLPAGVHRIGGFGGVAGLQRWLETERVDLVVDASHPFATRISATAVAAAEGAGCRYLRLERPGWRAGPGDRWQRVGDLAAALRALAGLDARRVFAAVGARAVPALADAPFAFVVRGIEAPAALPANVTWLSGRGPFTPEAERALLVEQRIDVVLSRDSGGDGARAKLDAARALDLPVLLLERPPRGTGAAVADVAGAVAVVDRLVSG